MCVTEEVRLDVSQRLNDAGSKCRDAMEKVVTQLHHLPCANPHPDVQKITEGEMIDTSWNEFKAFQNKAEPFYQPARWSTADVLNGQSHIWHENYSLPYTKVLGYVACRLTSKPCGIGPAERCWSAVKLDTPLIISDVYYVRDWRTEIASAWLGLSPCTSGNINGLIKSKDTKKFLAKLLSLKLRVYYLQWRKGPGD